jgi:arylformamidase
VPPSTPSSASATITYPGLPRPAITPYLTRQASRDHYAPGTEFTIDELTLIGNTATYLDAPYHRYPDGADLSSIPLARTVDLPAMVVTAVPLRIEGFGTIPVRAFARVPE